jgi:hypothetical protein
MEVAGHDKNSVGAGFKPALRLWFASRYAPAFRPGAICSGTRKSLART